MIFQNYPFFYIFFISAFVTGFTAYYAWNRRSVRSAKTFAILMGLTTWWTFFYACELVSAEPQIQFFFLNLEYLAIPWIPGFLIWFSLEFGGYEKYCTREGLLVIFSIPVMIFISFFTNTIFHLLHENFTYITFETLIVPSFTPGIMYRVENIEIIASQIFCFLIILKVFLSSPRLFKPQLAVLIGCMILGFICMILFFLTPKPYPNFDVQPIFLAIINIFVLTAIFRFHFFDLIHIPYHSIFENLEEGIIVLDAHNRIIQMNRKASVLLELEPDRILGEELHSTNSILTPFYDTLTSNAYVSIRVSDNMKDRDVSLLIDMYPVFDSSSHLQTRMMILRDISEITRTSQALSKAGEKLSLLNSITRHDILNQVTIISGYGAMMTDCLHNDAQCQKQLQQINNASDSVRNLIMFTATYQDLGVENPIWLSVSDVAIRAWNTLHPPDSVSIRIDTDLMVFADMLLEKVFFNLMDNSMRHGTSVSRIHITSFEGEDGYLLVYEDNGGGIEPEFKERIFSQGFGKNTGYGLFLVREILSITSITIQETGEYGSGVRFEMRIPPHGVKNTKE
ncbi:MAG TPA: histidine kinase N-terminal 7TM domain-containing protein [Methanospirillum sp.]|nr:histidine kinase N-terminal 7TM domain-containing protein [Methanospirillum sp.]